MSPTKAALILDPERRAEQVAYVAERAEILHEAGGQLWVSMAEEQADRFAEHDIVVQLHEEADLIELPALTFDPAMGVPEPPENLSIAPLPQDTSGYYLVQFIAPAHPSWIHEILRLGGSYVQDLPVNVGVFRLTANGAEQTRRLEHVRWVGPYNPAYALNYALAGRAEPFTAVSLQELVVDPGSLPRVEEGYLQVHLFEDLGTDEVRDALGAAGAEILEDTGYGFVVDADGISRLLRVEGVFAVEIKYPVEPANDRAGVITGVNQVRNFRNVDFLVNLDGTGEIVGVMDTGLDAGTVAGNHPDLAGRILSIGNLAAPGTPVPDSYTSPPNPEILWHGTHVTGTIAGDGAKSSGRIRGVAPASHVVFHGPLVVSFLQAFRGAHNAGARVHNNSWGTSNIVTDNLYSKTADPHEIDKFCFTYPESLVVFIAQNYETDTQPAPDGALDMNRLPYQALAKNILTVGAVESRRSNDGFRDDYITYFGALQPRQPCPAGDRCRRLFCCVGQPGSGSPVQQPWGGQHDDA